MPLLYPSCKDDFFDSFTKNMEALGLPAPKSLFGSLTAATATAATILSTLDKLGKAATIAEVIGATTALEGLAVVGALSASFYVGAVIGSLAIATGESIERGLTCKTANVGKSSYNVVNYAKKAGLYRPWLNELYYSHPGLLVPDTVARSVVRAQVAGAMVA